jgi:hypothetical protein
VQLPRTDARRKDGTSPRTSPTGTRSHIHRALRRQRPRIAGQCRHLPHPATSDPVLGFATYGRVKIANLRSRPQLAATFRNGWQWATVEGRAELAGPDDPTPWLADGEGLRLLLREVFTAAGGTHDNWGEYDRVTAEQRRAVALVTPTRVYTNG